ncbi:MAG: hypothetical protein F6K26_31500 [Moorea sp. SIO2I5]|nr:hypothetical protein [Moorena sp. SIO2I5]
MPFAFCLLPFAFCLKWCVTGLLATKLNMMARRAPNAPYSLLPVPYSLFPIPYGISTNAFSNGRLVQVKSFAALGGVGVECLRLSLIN